MEQRSVMLCTKETAVLASKARHPSSSLTFVGTLLGERLRNL